MVEFCQCCRGFRRSSSEHLKGGRTIEHKSILPVINKNLVKKCLEMFAEAVEKKQDCKYSCEQSGTCVKL